MDRAVRKNYIVLFFMCMLSFQVIFSTDEELFLSGNKYYEQKNYDKALHSYQMMNKKGRAALYNIGNVYFYKGDYAQALVYWSRAEVGATIAEYNCIKKNKEHVLTLMGKAKDQSLLVTLFNLCKDTLPYISLFFLQILFLMCWYMLFFLSRYYHTKVKKMMLSSLCLLMMLCGVLLGVYYTNECSRNGIIVIKEGQLFAAPHKDFHKLCPVVYADNVKIKEVKEGWYKIQYADMIGWVEADVVQII